MTHNLLLLVFIFIFASCSTTVNEKDVAFSEKQLQFINPYKTNDTLFFEFENKSLGDDTVIIQSFKKEQNFTRGFMGPPINNYLDVQIKHLPIDKWQGTKTGLPMTIEYQRFISLSKIPEQGDSTVCICFKNFTCSFIPDTIKSMKQLSFGGKTYSCYALHHEFPERIKDNSYIETLFWNKKLGLIAYRTKGGGTWIKKTGH
ncbi:MAG TPA: hypothetical protein VN026_08945 [Bacteroidia bacterium]|jgi:hypothetical protein|nr:hypothetical protein [Bacteroidia bacterium]